VALHPVVHLLLAGTPMITIAVLMSAALLFAGIPPRSAP
jgi:hypothetical protein